MIIKEDYKGREFIKTRKAVKDIVLFWENDIVENYIECLFPDDIEILGTTTSPIDILQEFHPDKYDEIMLKAIDYFTEQIAENIMNDEVKPFRKIRIIDGWLYFLPDNEIRPFTVDELIEIKEQMNTEHFVEITVEDLIYV